MIMKKLVKNFSESELKELEGKWLFCRVGYNFDEDEVEDEDEFANDGVYNLQQFFIYRELIKFDLYFGLFRVLFL